MGRLPELFRLHRGNLQLLFVSFIWGINSIAVKDALRSFLPLQFNAVRLLVSAVLLLAILTAREKLQLPPRKDWFTLVLAGFLGNTLYQFTFIKGMALSTASNTSFVLATMPATTALLSHFMHRQRMTGRMWAGVLLALTGVTVIILDSGRGLSLGSKTLAGDFTTLSGTVGFCLCTIFASDLTGRMSPLAYTTWTMVSGALLLLPLSVGELRSADWSKVSPLNWFELLFSASFALVLGYILWNTGVKESGPASTAVFGNLSPVWTGVFASLILHESWTTVKVAGAAAVLAGVLLVRLGEVSSSPSPRKDRADDA